MYLEVHDILVTTNDAGTNIVNILTISFSLSQKKEGKGKI